MSQHKVSLPFHQSLLLFAGFMCGGLSLQAQTPMVQVPFVSSVLGIPTSTFSSTTAASACTNGLNAAGDGCPGTATTLYYTYGIAVDTSGDLAVATAAGSVGVTVLYQGGSAMSNLLVGAKPNYTFTPTLGHAYFLTNGTANLTQTGTTYYCNGTSGIVALDKYANGCPATYAYLLARSVTMDPDGNIFLGEYIPNQSVRVIYAGGTRAANLIKAYAATAYSATVAAGLTPQVGYVYALSNGAAADFGSIRGIAVQPVNATNENVFVSDNATSATATGLDAGTTGNQVKEFVCPTTATGCNTTFASTIVGNTNANAGWATYIPGTTTTGTTSQYGDGGLPSGALVDDPTCLVVDQYGNLFIGDVNDARIRVVYNGGVTPPLFEVGVNSNAYVTPTAGHVYTVLGGTTTLPSSPAPGNTMATNATNFGVDTAGNLYFTKSPTSVGSTFWVENAATGVAVNLMWTGSGSGDGENGTTFDFTANANPTAGAACNGTSGGPVMTDSYGDGCPGTEVSEDIPNFTPIVFDTTGNFYLTDARQTAGATAVVHKYSFGNAFGPVAVGSSATVAFAFTPSANKGGTSVYTPVLSFSSPEYTDAGGDTCSTITGIYATQTCVYNIAFKPTRAGVRPGSVTLSQSGVGTLASIVLGGIGTAAQTSLDPATLTTVGTGLVPAGTAVDTTGNVYVSDATSGNVYKSAAGGTPASFATGLSKPVQIAASGSATVYIADSGNNRIASVPIAGGAVSAFLPTTFTLTSGNAPSASVSATLSGPQGVAVDQAGDVYVSDTGNNRVIEIVTPQGGGASTNTLLGFTGLSSPKAIAVDANGDVFVADSGNSRVVELSAAGVQSTVIASPSLSTPVGVSLDAAGDVYIADSGTQSVVLVTPGATTTTLLLGGTPGLTGVAVDGTGNAFIAASGAGGILELNRTAIGVAYPLTNVGATSTQTLTLTNTGNASLTTGASLAASTDTTNFTIAPATTNGCTLNQSVSSGSSCNLAAIFSPQSVGKFTDTVTFPTSSAINAPAAVLTGSGAKETPTTTTLSYATNPPVSPTGSLPIAGVAFTVTATIVPSANVGTPSGTVTFTVDGIAQKPVTITAGNSVTAAIQLTLNAGSHTVVAVYNGDSNYAGSNANFSVTVVTPQTTTLAFIYSLGSPSGAGTINTTLTATLTAPATPVPFTGTVTFTVDSVAQTPATVSSGGVAAITLPLAGGSHTVLATYNGTSYFSTSSATQTFIVVTGTSSLSLTASPTGAITFGNPVMVTALTTTGNSTLTPTGTIVFTVNGQAQTPVAYAPSVSMTFPQLTTGKYTVTASYSGDSNFAPAQSQSAIAITVVQSPSTAALEATPNIVAAGNTITLSATIGPAHSPIYPTGSVVFTNGTSALGTAQLLASAAGVATLTVPASSISVLTFTAAYGGDSNYLPSTATITSAPAFVVSSASSTLTVAQNAVVTDALSVGSFYGYTGTIGYACTGLPANTTCAFAPVTTVFSAGTPTQAVQLQVFTNASPLATAANVQKDDARGIEFASCVGLALCFALPAWRRRRPLIHLVLSILMLAVMLGAAGCGSDTASSTVYQTPTGTYAIGIKAADGTSTTTTPITVIVIPGPSAARPN